MDAVKQSPDQIQVAVSDRGETILTVAGEQIEASADPFPRMDPRLEAILGTLDDVIASAEAEFEIMTREYNVKKESLRRLRNLRRAASGPEITQPTPQVRKKEKKAKAWTPSEELKRKVLSGVTDKPRIASEIHANATERVGLESVHKTLHYLREEGRVRMVGLRQGKQGPPVKQYVITANGRS